MTRNGRLSSEPHGIFDRSALGKSTKDVTVEAEAGRIAFFADVIGETDPIHFDRSAARAAGYPDLVAPATFAAVLDLEAGRILRSSGAKDALQLINCDFKKLLHTEERLDFGDLIFAGDSVGVRTSVVGFEDKKDGALEFAHLSTSLTHPTRGTLAVITRSLVHRLA